MSKKKFKLDLNKNVISNLQARSIRGGGTTVESNDQADVCHYHLIHFKTDFCFSDDYQCPWSGPNTQ